MIAAICVYYLLYYNLLPARKYSADDFGIDAVHSSIDFNGNGLDDYTDFLLGAKADAENRPKYDGRYFSKMQDTAFGIWSTLTFSSVPRHIKT